MTRLDPLPPGLLGPCESALGRIYEMVGYRPNALATMARKSAALNTLLALIGNVFREPGRLSSGFKFLIAYVASDAANCPYSSCHAVHAAHHGGETDARAEAITSWRDNALFSSRERAAFELAHAAGTLPTKVTNYHFEVLRMHYDEEEIAEIAMSIALFGWFNRWNSMMATDLETDPYRYAVEHLGGHWTPGQHRVPPPASE